MRAVLQPRGCLFTSTILRLCPHQARHAHYQILFQLVTSMTLEVWQGDGRPERDSTDSPVCPPVIRAQNPAIVARHEPRGRKRAASEVSETNSVKPDLENSGGGTTSPPIKYRKENTEVVCRFGESYVY